MKVHIFVLLFRLVVFLTVSADFRHDIFNKAKIDLEKVGINRRRTGGESTKGAEVIKELIKKGHLSQAKYEDLVNDDEVAKRLLCGNVFAMDIKTSTVTFQSTTMKNYCQEHLEIWGGMSSWRLFKGL